MMWAVSKRKFSNLLDRIARTVHLDANRTIEWYSYILFLIPIALWLMIEMRILASKQSWTVMFKQPAVAVGVIIAFVDLMTGYYLLLKEQEVLETYENYRFFMMWQAISQILVGNFLCFVMALIGIHEAKSLKNGQRDATVTVVSIVSGLFLVICFGFILLMSL